MAAAHMGRARCRAAGRGAAAGRVLAACLAALPVGPGRTAGAAGAGPDAGGGAAASPEAAAGWAALPAFREPHPWSKRARGLRSDSAARATPRVDWSKGPAWVWENARDEQVRGAPLIDADSNVYIYTGAGSLLKFDMTGRPLWEWRTTDEESAFASLPMLYEGSVYVISTGVSPHQGYAFAVSMESGVPKFRAEMPLNYWSTLDCWSIFVHAGIMVVPSGAENRDLNMRVLGLDASNGDLVWEYDLDQGVWNFMPSALDDDSIVFSGSCGRAWRLNITTGQNIWSAGPSGLYCSTGGGALGPNGIFYAVASYQDQWFKAKPFPDIADCSFVDYCPDGPGLLVAYRASDGAVLFKRRFMYEGNQYPAVGMIGSRLTVVVSMGRNPEVIDRWYEQWLWMLDWVSSTTFHNITDWLFAAQWRSPALRWLLGIPVKQGRTVAFDAATLDQLWFVDDEPSTVYGAKGEHEQLFRRRARARADPRYKLGGECDPDSWGIPVIAGDGTVYASSGVTGLLYAIRDSDGDGEIGGAEVRAVRFGAGFLNTPSVASDLLAVAPCWGPVSIFRGEA